MAHALYLADDRQPAPASINVGTGNEIDRSQIPGSHGSGDVRRAVSTLCGMGDKAVPPTNGQMKTIGSKMDSNGQIVKAQTGPTAA